VKILHVIPSFAPAFRYGGPIHAAFELTREQAKAGNEISVFTTNVDVDGDLQVSLGRPVRSDQVEVWYWPVERPRGVTFSRALGGALRDQVSRFDIVHIHSIFNWPTTIAAYWARSKRVPYIIRPAGSLDPISLAKSYDKTLISLKSRAKKWLYFRTPARIELDSAAAIHFTTEAERTAALPLKLRAPSLVVPLGVSPMYEPDESPEETLRARYRELRGRKIILFLSRLNPVKGLEILISALGLLAPQRDDFALVVAGDGPKAYREELTNLVERNGLGGRAVFLGPVFGRLKWRILAESDIFVLNSYHENFGLAVAEALAAGLPVVISRHVNLEGEIRSAQAGFVVGLSRLEVSRAIEMLLDSEPLRHDMGNRGRALASQRFAWPSVVQSLNSAYLQITNRSTAVNKSRPCSYSEQAS
jgi:glycosyltransferase involved in cell wall biosynthesis